MSKYEGLKYWSRVKARVPHRCQRCGAQIGRGELYYKEKIDFVRPPPGLMFDELCEKCGEETKGQAKRSA